MTGNLGVVGGAAVEVRELLRLRCAEGGHASGWHNPPTKSPAVGVRALYLKLAMLNASVQRLNQRQAVQWGRYAEYVVVEWHRHLSLPGDHATVNCLTPIRREPLQ